MDGSELLEQTWHLWNSHKRTEIVPLVEQEGSPKEVMEKYLTLQGGFFWNKRSLEAVLAISKWGLAYARVRRFPEAENVLLYNTSTFTLPWWHDSLDPTDGQKREGHLAAKALLDLRRSLGKGPADMSMAHWAAGAHALHSGDAAGALAHFNASFAAAKECSDKGLQACALDGLGRTRALLSPEDRDWGRETLAEAKALFADSGKQWEFNLKEIERFEARAGLRFEADRF